MTEIYGLLIIEGLELRLSQLRREGGHFEDLEACEQLRERLAPACSAPGRRCIDAAGDHPFAAAFSLGCHGKLDRRLMRNRSAALRPWRRDEFPAKERAVGSVDSGVSIALFWGVGLRPSVGWPLKSPNLCEWSGRPDGRFPAQPLC
jgi:hypothetical protein